MFDTILAATPRSGSDVDPAGMGVGGRVAGATGEAGDADTGAIGAGADTGAGDGAVTAASAGASAVALGSEPLVPIDPDRPAPFWKYSCQLGPTDVGLSAHFTRISSTSQALGPSASSSGLSALTALKDTWPRVFALDAVAPPVGPHRRRARRPTGVE